MNHSGIINTYKEFSATEHSPSSRLDLLRNLAVGFLSHFTSRDGKANGVRFPIYHFIFDDEAVQFEKQVRYLKNFGDFISMDAAVELITGASSLNGRYFCLHFDDGYRNALTNGMEVLLNNDVPATFFIVTEYIGKTMDRIPRLSWDDCRELVDNNMAIGSHTSSHVHFQSSSADAVKSELVNSKREIETRLSITCEHFCCPFGKPGIDFNPGTHPDLAKNCGYKSFSTVVRGINEAGASPFLLNRDSLLAHWSLNQLKFFFSL